MGVGWIVVTEINGLAPSEDPRKQINSMWLPTTQGSTCLWEVWAGRARDIGVLDLGLGLEAGPEQEPEAGYSTASWRGSLARTRNVMLLFRQRATVGDRPAILGIFKLVSLDA